MGGLKRIKWQYVFGGVFAVVMGVQLFYPSSRVLPNTYLGKTAIGLKSEQSVRAELLSREKVVTMQFNGKTTTHDPTEAGVALDVEKTLDSMPDLTLVERLIPLWPYIKSIKKHTVSPVIQRDEKKIAQFATNLASDLYREPINAIAEIKEGSLEITEAKEGETYSTETVNQFLRISDPFFGDPINFEPATKPADIYEEDLTGLKEEFAKIVAQPLNIKYGDTTKQYDAKKVTSWLRIVLDPASNVLQIVVDNDAIEPTLKQWNSEFTIAAGTTQLHLTDNVETSRKNGATGRTLDTTGIRNQITAWTKKPNSEVLELASQLIAPRVVVTRTYSQSSAGLLAKLKFWIETHPGKYQVAIRELGGQGREASYNVSQQTVMASTYKTFLAYVAYKQSEAGALDLNAGLVSGKNIEQCIEVMIVNSDNDCAVALGKHIGWAKVDQIIASNGFSDVRLNNYDSSGKLSGDKLVNAREQANFLAQLSAGSLISQPNTNKLLSYMKRQIHRNGIPAGSYGAVVADKVGFLEGYLHDVGIVYAPKATYALVIMSEGSSWTNISSLSSAIYEFMN